MNLLVVDSTGLTTDILLRAIKAGHSVKWYIPKHEGERLPVGDGLVDRVDNWEKFVDWADFIWAADNINDMEKLTKYKKKGYPIYGPESESAKLELDRNYGQDILKKAGVKIMPYDGPFNDFNSAIKFIKKNPVRWVSKPCGEELDKSLSYVSQSAADMIFMMQKWRDSGSKQSFILQKFSPGIEVAVGGYFGPHGWSQYFLENFEFKKLMNDELGPATGEQGTVVRYVKQSKLADMLLKPVTDVLEKLNYCGYVDVSAIVSEKDGYPYPLEFTMRNGYPTTNIMQALHLGDPIKWMYDLTQGKDSLRVMENKISVGVVLGHGDYPFNQRTIKENSGFPVYLDKVQKYHNNIHMCEVMRGIVPSMKDGKVVDAPQYVTAGTYVLVTTGVGDSVIEAKEKSYAIMKEIELPNNKQYRTDIGDRLEKQLPQLQKHGFMKGMSYGKKTIKENTETINEYTKVIGKLTRY